MRNLIQEHAERLLAEVAEAKGINANDVTYSNVIAYCIENNREDMSREYSRDALRSVILNGLCDRVAAANGIENRADVDAEMVIAYAEKIGYSVEYVDLLAFSDAKFSDEFLEAHTEVYSEEMVVRQPRQHIHSASLEPPDEVSLGETEIKVVTFPDGSLAYNDGQSDEWRELEVTDPANISKEIEEVRERLMERAYEDHFHDQGHDY